LFTWCINFRFNEFPSEVPNYLTQRPPYASAPAPQAPTTAAPQSPTTSPQQNPPPTTPQQSPTMSSPVTSSPTNAQATKSNNIAGIVGGVVGGLLVFGVIGGVVIHKKRQSSNGVKAIELEDGSKLKLTKEQRQKLAILESASTFYAKVFEQIGAPGVDLITDVDTGYGSEVVKTLTAIESKLDEKGVNLTVIKDSDKVKAFVDGIKNTSGLNYITEENMLNVKVLQDDSNIAELADSIYQRLADDNVLLLKNQPTPAGF